jgi:uncharacterized membrane protein
MPKYIAFVSSLMIIVYPFAVYWGVSSLGIGCSALVIAGLFLLRFFFPPVSNNFSNYIRAVRVLAASGVALALLSWAMHDTQWFRYYPVAVNLIFLVLFGYSLFRPPSMIERFARVKNPDLPESGVNYTRRVTGLWCVFFLCNGLAALYTAAAATFKIWVLYNGLISYLLIGALLAGEYCFRLYCLKRSRF